MAEIIRWESPDSPKEAQGLEWQSVAVELTENPGQWALIFEGAFSPASNLAQKIKKGTLVPFGPAGTFEAVTRTVKPHGGSKVRVYARRTAL